MWMFIYLIFISPLILAFFVFLNIFLKWMWKWYFIISFQAVRYFEIKYDLCATRIDPPLAHYALEFFLTSMDVENTPKFAMCMTDLKANLVFFSLF